MSVTLVSCEDQDRQRDKKIAPQPSLTAHMKYYIPIKAELVLLSVVVYWLLFT